MPDIIRLLPDTVANQIAAGEVVQRPSSVVKELLENSIDADAKQIQLIVKESGRSLIQIVDDGMGMSVTDVRMAFERHATSKIATTEDIFHIHTKGFRGEALASIAAVAQVDIKTRREEDELGNQLIIEGGSVTEQCPVNTSKGTSLAVKNLFYNVPARRKFLKSNQVELRHILDEFHRVALAHEDIKFQLFVNNDELFRLRSGSLLQRISEIFGKRIQNQLVPISEELDWIKVYGFIGKPERAKKIRGEQFFFVNHRFFRSSYFNKAIQDAYEGLIPPRYLASFFLYITIDTDKIDVNIHPTKTEVKFEDEASIYALLRTAVKRSLGIYNVAPSLDFEQDPDLAFPAATENTQITEPRIKINPNYNPFEQGGKSQSIRQIEKVSLQQIYAESRKEVLSTELFDLPEVSNQEVSFLRLSNGRWVVEENNELWFLDPYRIHQTIIYERYIKNRGKSILSQQLLFPIERPVYGLEKQKLDSIKTSLFAEGFDLEVEEDIMTVTAIPSDVPQEKILQLIDDLLAELDEHSENEFSAFYSKSIARISARNRNEFILPSQIYTIWESFKNLGFPAYNPFKKRNYEIVSFPITD